jgi:cytochrome c peroxidase
MDIPEDNLLTDSRIALGRKLFTDPALSLDSSISCTHCHLPHLAFTDGQAKSLGIEGRIGKRNAPSLINAGYLDLINRDGGVRRLDLQAMVPIEDENEMGISVLKVSERLNQNQAYRDLAQKAYQDTITPFVITRALGSFLRTLVQGDSPYDRYLQGDHSALSASARSGLEIFASERLNCTACHQGFNLTNNQFANNGLYHEYADLGRFVITLDSADIGRFRVPSLRNVALTSPYMHDGSLPDLDAVLDHYEQAGHHPTPWQSPELQAFTLTANEREDLKAFLEALTGSSIPEVQ